MELLPGIAEARHDEGEKIHLHWRTGCVLVLFMVLAAAYSLTDRFTWLFDGLCKAIGVDAQRQRVEAALAWAIWNRVRLLGDRLIALAERVRAGRLPRRRARRREGTAHPDPLSQGERGRAAAVAVRLPREFGWVARTLPEAGKYAGALRYLLRDPETMALLEKAPEAGRMLRPLCDLLGVRPPEFLRRGAVVAQQAEAPCAELELHSPEPEALERPPSSAGIAIFPTSPGLSAPERGEGSAAAEEGASVAPAAQPPPQPARPSAEEAALAYARRPGGLYWDGKRFRWS